MEKTNRETELLPIFLALSIALLPQVFRLPVWISTGYVCCWLYALQAERRRWHLPNAVFQHVLALVGFIAVLHAFGFEMDRDTGVALLAAMSGLKALELRTDRDRKVAVLLAYFIVLSNLLYSDSLSMTLYMFFSVWTTTTALVRLNDPKRPSVEILRLSGRLMYPALPMMVALFFLSPRVHGSLWGSAGGSAAKSGFSEALAPGDIIKIVQNDDIAFRAVFSGSIPKRSLLYWRGLVFWHFDGKSWQRGMQVPNRKETVTGEGIQSYRITLEPHEGNFRFALDVPVSAPPHVRLLDDLTMTSRRRVFGRISYALQSYSIYHTGPLKPWERKALQVPATGNPKSRALAAKWASIPDGPEAIVERARAYFAENGFVYTLEPPPLDDNDRIDQFLFDTRKGYCEHFASAFAFLMRSAGVPSRIVAGYLGGERNPFGNYLIVRRSDAHAWVEVWLPSKGWTRIDPTSAAAPRRMGEGMAGALPPGEQSSYLSIPYLNPVFRVWKQMQLGWDAANTYWSGWMIGYTRERQRELFSILGVGASSEGIFRMIVFLAGSFGIALLIIFFTRKIPRCRRKEPVREDYRRFCRKLSRIGLERAPAQGPIDFARHVEAKRKDLSDEVNRITRLYVALRYGTSRDEGDGRKLRSMIDAFRPEKGGAPDRF
jgi:transglutaminase-like putative cysteine protease